MRRKGKPALIYDTLASGHRRRGVEVIAKLVSGHGLIAPMKEVLGTLIGHSGPMVWQTADYDLPSFFAIAILRSLRLRKTIALCYRNDRMVSGKRRTLRRTVRDLLSRLPLIELIYVYPPLAGCKQHRDWIYDTEWWDLQVLPLPDTPVSLPTTPGKRLILLIGNLSRYKGLEFFIAAAERAAETKHPLQFALVGRPNDFPPEDQMRFEAAGGIVRLCEPSDAEFVAYLKLADILWCCYHPSYDQSSGIFGRALQLDMPVIVRAGSLLESYLRSFGRGLSVEYGDVDGLLRTLQSETIRNPGPGDVTALYEHSARRLRQECNLQ